MKMIYFRLILGPEFGEARHDEIMEKFGEADFTDNVVTVIDGRVEIVFSRPSDPAYFNRILDPTIAAVNALLGDGAVRNVEFTLEDEDERQDRRGPEA
jgi:hypothetical protein